MGVVINTVNFAHDTNSALVFGPLLAPAQVTLRTSDIALMATGAGIDPLTQRMQLFEFDGQNTPLQLNLGTGDSIYVAPLPNNGDLQVSYLITN